MKLNVSLFTFRTADVATTSHNRHDYVEKDSQIRVRVRASGPNQKLQV